jgi:CubicO group peptidase (beta-lactamase class C family)
MILENLEELIELYKVPGASIIQMDTLGEVTINVAGHTRRIASGKITDVNKVTSSTRFQLASVSKMLTAWLVVELAKQKMLILDQIHYIHTKEGQATVGVTLRQLLCHRGGFSQNIGFTGETEIRGKVAYRKIGEQCIKTFNPKMVGCFQYSGCSYWFVQQVLEQLFGQRFNDLLQQWICRPCGMVHTTAMEANEGEPHMAIGHDAYGTELIGRWRSFPAVEAAAGIWTSAADIKCLLQAMLLDKTKLSGSLCLTNASDLVDRQLVNGYHLGVFVEHSKQGLFLNHRGINPGYQAVIRMNLKTGTACVILTNKEGCDSLCNMVNRLVL